MRLTWSRTRGSGRASRSGCRRSIGISCVARISRRGRRKADHPADTESNRQCTDTTDVTGRAGQMWSQSPRAVPIGDHPQTPNRQAVAAGITPVTPTQCSRHRNPRSPSDHRHVTVVTLQRHLRRSVGIAAEKMVRHAIDIDDGSRCPRPPISHYCGGFRDPLIGLLAQARAAAHYVRLRGSHTTTAVFLGTKARSRRGRLRDSSSAISRTRDCSVST